ncbi:MAG: NERD domain-containing protein [Butyrivibrio sp.]|uniref:NERD domain-containing protein n=1 Tax=Butyrivibrio sp. TaxID=28121 RepID=UPI001B50A862|nr:NERD domain-containing protein [Butyrivibrio sp.]MBP3784399.1 NERD domain-containing protein [Butyrivibrio sp.]
MSKTKCSNCGEAIEYSNSFCSKCGSEMPKNQIIKLNKEYSEKICSRYSALQELLESHKQAIRKLSLTPWDGFMTTASNSDFVKAYGGCLNKDGTVEYKGISKAKLSDILLMCEALFSQCMYEQKNEGNIHSEDYRSYLASLSGLNTINDPEAKETCLNLAKNISKFVLYMEYIDQALTKLEEDAKRLLKGYRGESHIRSYLESVVGSEGLYSNVIFDDPFQDDRMSENDLVYISKKGIITFEVKNNNYASIAVDTGRAEYRTHDGKIVEQDPLGQTRYHALIIRELLKQSGKFQELADIKVVKEAVIINNPETAINSNGYPVMNITGVEDYLSSLDDVISSEQVEALKDFISSINQNDSEREFEVMDYSAIFPEKEFWDGAWNNLVETLTLIGEKNADNKLIKALGNYYFVYVYAPVKGIFTRDIDKHIRKINRTGLSILCGVDSEFSIQDAFYAVYDKELDLWIKSSDTMIAKRTYTELLRCGNYKETYNKIKSHFKQ